MCLKRDISFYRARTNSPPNCCATANSEVLSGAERLRPLRASVPFNQCVFLGTDVGFSSTVVHGSNYQVRYYTIETQDQRTLLFYSCNNGQLLLSTKYSNIGF